jgi:Na+-translocating ferredoxin:NAD+ oxidoreductase subunit C
MIVPSAFRHNGLSLDFKRDWPLVSPVQNAFLPAEAVVLLRQHRGPAPRCVVRKGDFVREGQLLGKAEVEGSSPVHAPIPGSIREIREIRLPSGGSSQAVVIVLQGTFSRLGKREEKYLWTSMSQNDILGSLRDRGVIEMDGEGRPLDGLLRSSRGPVLFVLNCLVREPYLRTESTVLAERGAEVLEGFEIMRSVLEPERAVLALDSTELDLVESVKALLQDREKAPDCLLFPPRYPEELTRRLVESGCLPKKARKGAIFSVNPSTALAVYEAVVHAKPLVERYVTIAGGAVKRPAVLKVRIGTPLGDLVEECGGFLGVPERLVLGGPLCGEPAYDLDMPITKLTGAVIALTRDETNRGKRVPCIRCGRCVSVCPEGLDPEALFRRITVNREGEAAALGLFRCSRCGACGYICPSRIPLVEAFAMSKQHVEAKKR